MADSAETVKKTIEDTTAKANVQAERVQAAGTQAFREGMDKSVASLSELNAHGKKNLDAVVESATAAQKGAEAISQEAIGFAKKSWEDGVAAAQTFSSARSVQELMELQTSWAKSSMETYMSQVTKMTELFTASMKDSVKPINERVSASVERFQAAR
ncbi:phasin family protein [Brevundimonas sp. Leaf363]|uniref:phasin family protein n=1 Tax=Brevundimonas sp. Leaf363 TaxID=1736353 RepID=UPI0006F569FF|nr:TIGR01841 family phasin [Brevundimonas sp. Leaf363]KQS55798.1 phasin family protein [Brevundimonas sp. Leaf363]